MHKLPTILLVLIFSLPTLFSKAQNKYALVIGINNYYNAPGQLDKTNCLHGCVNDANAMTSFLVHRFGFTKENMVTLINDKATQQPVIDACFTLLKKCKRGDAFFFYYSGHGVYLENNFLYQDAVKRGFNNALCLSNLYAPNFDCLLRDSTIKRIINRFIDKGIVVTFVFDCCYSETVAALIAASTEMHNQYIEYTPDADPKDTISPDKSIEIRNLPQFSNAMPPRGCQLDTAGIAAGDEPDADGDGIPDCADWEVNTNKNCFPVSGQGVGSCSPFYFVPDYFDSAEKKLDDSLANDSSLTSRAFRFETIKINDTVFIPRPADRKNSAFLSLSATTYNEKAAEIYDESLFAHGAFTKALLSIYQNNPTSLPVHALFDSLRKEINVKQLFAQQPTSYMDSANRLHSNLLGIAEKNVPNTFSAICMSRSGNNVIINAGANDGLTNGNRLQNAARTVTISVAHLYADSAVAAVISGAALVKTGDTFTVTDYYATSKPWLKVYLPESKLAAQNYMASFTQKILPYTKQKKYSDYKNWNIGEASDNYFFDGNSFVKADFRSPLKSYQLPARTEVRPFYFFLSLPSDVSAALKKALGRDQNVQLVDSLQQADMVLYLNYASVSKDNKKAGFVLTYRPPLLTSDNNLYDRIFYTYEVSTGGLLLAKTAMDKLTTNILELTKTIERAKTSFHWLNEYPRK